MGTIDVEVEGTFNVVNAHYLRMLWQSRENQLS